MKNFIILLTILGLSSCSFFQKEEYSFLPIAKIYINKSDRKLMLLDELDGVIREYDIRLGFNPVGRKIMEGDGKTPEGKYRIVHHNPASKYYKSIKISYPNDVDTK